MIDNKNLLEFLKKIFKSKEKVIKLISYSDINEMYEYALSESDKYFTKEEFMDATKKIINLFSKILSEVKKTGKSTKEVIKEISDNDLESISGGVPNGGQLEQLQAKAPSDTPGSNGQAPKETVLRSLAYFAAPFVQLCATGSDLFTNIRNYNHQVKIEEEEKPFVDIQRQFNILQYQIKIEEAKIKLAALKAQNGQA